jgi:hypothetical protein
VSLRDRLARLRRAAQRSPSPDRLDVVILRPVGETGGWPPGLYRDGPPGSTAGVCVYDPAAGEPAVPTEHLAPWALVVGRPPDRISPANRTEREGNDAAE